MPSRSADPAAASVARILVVDDDPFMRGLLCRILADAGMEVASFGSAAELLLRSDDISAADALLLDLKMPGMGGLELHQQLQQRGVHLPVIFVSGTADLALAVTAMRHGAADFIEKPFEAATLVDRVRSAVARHAARAPLAAQRPEPQSMAGFASLTPREREVFALLVTGMSSKLIARELGGSHRTIEVHRAQVMRKLAARHLADLVRMSMASTSGHDPAER